MPTPSSPVHGPARATLDRALAALERHMRQSWVEPLVLVAFAAFTAGYAVVTVNPPHRAWAVPAAVGYAAGAAVLAAGRGRPGPRHRCVAGAVLVAATVLVPLVWQAVRGVANPEIAVLRIAAARWLRTGTPFPNEAELAGQALESYNVYLPLMAVFGLPSAVLGASAATDPRIYLTAACFAAFGVLGRRRPWTAVLFLTSPWAALQLASGATDLPVLAAICIGLVLADRNRPAAAGLAVGTALGLKALAWPVLLVAALLVGTRAQGRWRALGRFAATLLPVLVLALGLPALTDPRAFVVNVVALPLNLLPVRFGAESPLPGHLLATSGPVGHAIVLVLLVGAACAIAVALLRRPPRDYASAARWLALGLLVAVLLAPATRFGYTVYPVGLLLLPLLVGAGRGQEPAPR